MCRIAKEIIKKTNLAKEVKNIAKKLECKKISNNNVNTNKINWNIPKHRRLEKKSWLVK
jgi:hypothetical protein